MPLIARESIEELNRVIDIVDVISPYVKLRPASGSLKGLCPFHKEKTPSFDVSPTKQLYHCFGCGAGGGAVDFIMKMENLDYVDALKFLADKYNVVLREEKTARSNEQMRQHELRKRIYEINRIAARYYYDTFMGPSGVPAREYAAKRGLDAGTVNKYGIGYAPDAWSGICDVLTEKGYSEYEQEQSGLVIKKDTGRRYDRFRNRLMFPIIDVRGNVIGFGGRAMDDGVKYLNSPETPVFHKGYNVFSLNLAKNIGPKEGLILVEGYMDVVSLYQRGITNAVAGLGTALTPDQAKLLKRYASEVYVCYDNDEAGHKAAMRALEVLEAEGNKLRVVEVAGVKDPDEYIQKKGVESFRALLKSAKTATAYRIATLRRQYDLTDVAAKVEYVQAVAALLAGLDSAVERDAYIKRVAFESDISADSIAVEVNRRLKDTAREAQRVIRREQRRPVERKPVKNAANPAYKAQRMLLNLIFFEKKAYTIVTEQYGEELFAGPTELALYRKMVQFKKENSDVQLFLNELDAEERSAAAELLYHSYVFADSGEVTKAVMDCIDTIRMEQMKANAKKLSGGGSKLDLAQANEMIEKMKRLKKGGA